MLLAASAAKVVDYKQLWLPEMETDFRLGLL